MTKTGLMLWAALAMLVCTATSATQLSFSQTNGLLNYRWLDAEHTEHQLSVDYRQTALSLTTFVQYSPQRLNQAMQQRATSWFEQQQFNGLQLKRNRVGLQYELQLIGSDPQLVAATSRALRQQQQIAHQEYLTQHHYKLFKDFTAQWAVKPDHSAIAELSQADLIPLAMAFEPLIGELSEPDGINLILGFIQSIPYSSLGSDPGQRGTGFSPPAQLLFNNQGDCDSKATLMAALMMQLYPNMRVAMVLVPGHALLGIDLPNAPGQKTLNLAGKVYVLAEPTGPAKLTLGTIGRETQQALAQKQLRSELFPAPIIF